jgi:hypothetical protein
MGIERSPVRMRERDHSVSVRLGPMGIESSPMRKRERHQCVSEIRTNVNRE